MMVKLIKMRSCGEHKSAKINACSLCPGLFMYAVIAGCTCKLTTASFTVNDSSKVSSTYFSEKLISEWGSDGVIDAVQLGRIFERLGIDETLGKQEKSNVSSTFCVSYFLISS